MKITITIEIGKHKSKLDKYIERLERGEKLTTKELNDANKLAKKEADKIAVQDEGI